MPPRDSQHQYPSEPLYGPAGGPMSQAIPLHGPVSHPDGPRDYPYSHLQHLTHFPPHPPTEQSPVPSGSRPPIEDKNTLNQDYIYAEAYHRGPESQPPSPGHESASSHGGAGANHYPSSNGVPRLPPILQVEKQQVTTSATQLASASRRRNEAHFVCPVPGCGSTFTRRFNLRGHLRSHTEERPYVCEWPGCKKGFARQHDCKRHQALHSAKSQNNVCRGCKKAFSRLDALNRHLRSDGGAECRASNLKIILVHPEQTFRSATNSATPDQDAARFFSSTIPPTQLGAAYDLSALHSALPQPQLHTNTLQLQQPAPMANWAADFTVQPMYSPSSNTAFKGKEVALRHDVVVPNNGLQQVRSVLPHAAPMQWNMANMGPMSFSPAPLHQQSSESSQISWDKEFSTRETAIHQTPLLEQTQVAEKDSHQIPHDADDLARTAGLLLDNVRNEQNPKFQNSQFLDLMRKLRDRDVIVEGNDMVQNEGQQAPDVKGKGRETDNGSSQSSQMRTSAPLVGQPLGKPRVSFAESAPHHLAQPVSNAGEDANDAYFRQENADYQQYWNDARTANTSQPTANTDVASWERLQHDWDQFETTATGIKRVDNYQFQDNNPYLLGDSSATRQHMMHTSYQSLSETVSFLQSVLQLEAAVQRDMSNSMAWFELGVKQQENEREQKAFQALKRSLELDPSHLPTWLALGVSNTNESNRTGTYDAINEWVSRNNRYEAAVQQFRANNPLGADTSLGARYSHLINTLIAMARSDTSGAVDADTQIALAILLNTNEVQQTPLGI
ncbi:hypothetical protein C0991_011365 [Blastosporella zonata]|nr:hypothetical protein C0991_011365 [Blastosporella zonata]